jgi:hypothetical protein
VQRCDSATGRTSGCERRPAGPAASAGYGAHTGRAKRPTHACPRRQLTWLARHRQRGGEPGEGDLTAEHAIDSNSGGLTVDPVTATRTGCATLPNPTELVGEPRSAASIASTSSRRRRGPAGRASIASRRPALASTLAIARRRGRPRHRRTPARSARSRRGAASVPGPAAPAPRSSRCAAVGGDRSARARPRCRRETASRRSASSSASSSRIRSPLNAVSLSTSNAAADRPTCEVEQRRSSRRREPFAPVTRRPAEQRQVVAQRLRQEALRRNSWKATEPCRFDSFLRSMPTTIGRCANCSAAPTTDRVPASRPRRARRRAGRRRAAVVQQRLPRGHRQQVLAAADQRDALGDVVDRVGQRIGRLPSERWITGSEICAQSQRTSPRTRSSTTTSPSTGVRSRRL